MTRYTTELLTPRRLPRRSRAALVGTVALVAVALIAGWVQRAMPARMQPIILVATAQPPQARGLAKSVRTFSARPTPTAAPTSTPVVIVQTVVVPVSVPVEAPAPAAEAPEATATIETFGWPAPTPSAPPAWTVR